MDDEQRTTEHWPLTANENPQSEIRNAEVRIPKSAFGIITTRLR